MAVGGLIGTLSRAGGPLCEPQSLRQGHDAWHVLAATALVILAPAVEWDAVLPTTGSRVPDPG